MDDALDLVITPAFTPDLTGTYEEAAAENPEGAALQDGEARTANGVLWLRESDRLYRECAVVIPPAVPLT